MSAFNLCNSENPLIVMDLANNHDGSIEHAKKVIDDIVEVTQNFPFPVAVKFQYRDLPNFIHPDFRERLDLKYVNRFLSTRLEWNHFLELKNYVKEKGLLTACTPFDEYSVQKIIEHDFDILKIASASFTDWSLLETAQIWSKELILSTAGASIAEVDRVYSFMKNRNKSFALMHCVAAYPTKDSELELNRISLLQDRYKDILVGYSTHEDPSNYLAAPLALAKGASILERHVGHEDDSHNLNAYSSSKENLKAWLTSISSAISMLGSNSSVEKVNLDEQKALTGLRRYAFAKREISTGEKILQKDLFYGIPGDEDGITANYLGKYISIIATTNIKKNAAITNRNVQIDDTQERVSKYREMVCELIYKSGAVVPNISTLEISHHYGLEKFEEFGSAMITVVNRDYCKKLIIGLPNQVHPDMYHKEKDETFLVLLGNLKLKLNDENFDLKPGDTISIQPGTVHGFYSENGYVIEEVSSNHNSKDSYYLDEAITKNENRKTFVQFWI